MKTHHLTKEMARIMVKEMMEAMIRKISRKKEKIMMVVMVDPIEVMENRHLLMKISTTSSKNSNNSMGHNKKEKI